MLLLAASFYVYAIRQVVPSTAQLDVTTICTITYVYSRKEKERISTLTSTIHTYIYVTSLIHKKVLV